MIRCWIFRIATSWAKDADADAGRVLSPSQARHRNSCVNCCRLYEIQSGMLVQLKAEARECARRQKGPTFLHGKIMARLAASEANVGSKSPAWSGLLTGAVAGAAIIVVLAILTSALAARRSRSGQSAAPVAVGPSLASLQLDFTHASVLLSQPLETEVQALAKDARSALDLLAQNFLPTPE